MRYLDLTKYRLSFNEVMYQLIREGHLTKERPIPVIIKVADVLPGESFFCPHGKIVRIEEGSIFFSERPTAWGIGADVGSRQVIGLSHDLVSVGIHLLATEAYDEMGEADREQDLYDLADPDDGREYYPVGLFQ